MTCITRAHSAVDERLARGLLAHDETECDVGCAHPELAGLVVVRLGAVGAHDLALDACSEDAEARVGDAGVEDAGWEAAGDAQGLCEDIRLSVRT